jgi:hypothetical protein
MFTSAVVNIVVRNTIFRKAPPSVVSGYGERSLNLVSTSKVRPEMTTNDGIQNVQRESKHGFIFCGNYILKYW